ncbi:hypothetical protein ACSBR2_035340 [Camellia fascicularis]
MASLSLSLTLLQNTQRYGQFVYSRSTGSMPLTISYSSPIQMDGESLDRSLSSSQTNVYTAALFYASYGALLQVVFDPSLLYSVLCFLKSNM